MKTSSLLALIFWVLGILGTLPLIFHVAVTLSYHLYQRFVAKTRSSDLESEIYRYVFGVTAMSYALVRCVEVGPNGKGNLLKTEAHCRVYTYLMATLICVNIWSLLGFLLGKLAVAQKLRLTMGMEPSAIFRPLRLSPHIICALLLVSYLVTLTPHSNDKSHSVYQCRTHTGVVTTVCEALVLVILTMLSYLFVDSMVLVYRAHHKHFTHQRWKHSDIAVNEKSLDNLQAIARLNATWCLGSIATLAVVDVVHISARKHMLHKVGRNAFSAAYIWTLLFNAFVMARVVSWKQLYGQYIERLQLKYEWFERLSLCCAQCCHRLCCVNWCLAAFGKVFDRNDSVNVFAVNATHGGGIEPFSVSEPTQIVDVPGITTERTERLLSESFFSMDTATDYVPPEFTPADKTSTDADKFFLFSKNG